MASRAVLNDLLIYKGTAFGMPLYEADAATIAVLSEMLPHDETRVVRGDGWLMVAR